LRYIFLLIKKMVSSRQKAVKAFLDAVCDNTMLDRLIPDEDCWVLHQIWENGKNNCSILNLNTVMPQQCVVWKHNYDILRETTIFYKKKNVQTSKTKATNKAIRFYCVLLAGKPALTVPSNQSRIRCTISAHNSI
jgi:hypothetical protein